MGKPVHELLADALRIKQAMEQNPDVGELKRLLGEVEDKQDRAKVEAYYIQFVDNEPQTQIVVLLHGIRTRAEWQDQVSQKLESIPNTKVLSLGYGFFDLFKFWFPFFTRQGPIRRITRDLNDIIASNPSSQIVVFAHSFGTYIVSEILRDEPHIKFSRLLLCGSIIKEDYRWANLASCPGLIVNDAGRKDIWPVIAAAITWGYGPSGRYGFKTSRVRDRFHDIAHSDFFEPALVEKYWLPFAATGQYVPREVTGANKTGSYFISILPLLQLKWFLVAGALFGVASYLR